MTTATRQVGRNPMRPSKSKHIMTGRQQSSENTSNKNGTSLPWVSMSAKTPIQTRHRHSSTYTEDSFERETDNDGNLVFDGHQHCR